MVFAVWAGHSTVLTAAVASTFRESFEWGLERTEEMVELAAEERGFGKALTRQYLTRHIVYRLKANHLKGLELFRRRVRELDPLPAEMSLRK